MVNNNKITANSGIWVFFNDTYQSYAAAPINTTTDNTNHNAVFTTTTVPTGTITGWIRVVDSVNDILPITRGGTGCGTLAAAQSALGITELNNNLNAKVNKSITSYSNATRLNELRNMFNSLNNGQAGFFGMSPTDKSNGYGVFLRIDSSVGFFIGGTLNSESLIMITSNGGVSFTACSAFGS